jgi:CheY-like chemotaxis protein
MTRMAEGVTLVIVDDDAAGRRMLRRALERRGYQVREAGDGASGLALVREHRPAAALLDLRMPGELSGIDVARALKEDETTRHIPVLIVSASVHTAAQELAHEVGAVGFVEKPVDFATLYRALDSALGTTGS